MAPEQWWGTVDGHSFYFRERHDDWRIELDLRATGQFSTVWIGGDLDDETSFEQREIEAGDVIAEGTTADAGYGDSPVARLHFIVETIPNASRPAELRGSHVRTRRPRAAPRSPNVLVHRVRDTPLRRDPPASLTCRRSPRWPMLPR
jgi:hypothetical protein